MSTAAELIESRVDPIADETRIGACRTVAAYATDDDDREMLLKMLGLDSAAADRKRPPAKRRAPHPKCPYGHRLRKIDQSCMTCKEYVPITELRLLIDRIIAETGLKTAQIARRAFLESGSFAGSLRASHRVRRSTYAAVLLVAEQLKVDLS